MKTASGVFDVEPVLVQSPISLPNPVDKSIIMKSDGGVVIPISGHHQEDGIRIFNSMGNNIVQREDSSTDDCVHFKKSMIKLSILLGGMCLIFLSLFIQSPAITPQFIANVTSSMVT